MAEIIETGDAPEDPPSGYLMEPGDRFNGSIGVPDDEDVVAFRVTDAGADYAFVLTPGTGLDYAVGAILFPDGERLTSRTTFSGTQLEIPSGPSELRPIGEYYFRVFSYEDRSTGSYQALLVEDTGRGYGTNGLIGRGASVTEQMHYAADEDWFALDMAPDRSNTFVVIPDGERGSDDPDFGVSLIGDERVRSKGAVFDDGVTVASSLDNPDRDWFLSLNRHIDGVDNGYSIHHVVEALPDHRSHLRGEVGTPFEGLLEFRGDEDGIGVDLVAGERYEVLVEGAGTDPAADLLLDEFTLGVSFHIDRDTEFDDRPNHFIGRISGSEDATVFFQVSSSDAMQTGGYSLTVTPVTEDPEPVEGTDGPDTLDGTAGADEISGHGGDDLLRGMDGDDTLLGGDGNDTLNGGDGDDLIRGGDTADDRRDVIYAGSGNDSVDGGYGNDLIFGQDGNDTLAGGFGADELQGQNGDDVITGSAFGDIVFGNAGNDFVNGGFGHDLINGGTGADKFFHVGGTAEQMEGHGSDWVQDYNSAEGDVLVFGGSATANQFQVNLTHTANKTTGERSGDDDVEEAFVIYKPTGQILWALVDGGGQASINLQIGGDVFDLLG